MGWLVWKNGTTPVASWQYGYDGAGRMISVTATYADAPTSPETTTYSYDGEGKLTSQTDANGVTTAYTYNQQRGWPTSIATKKGSTAISSYALTYDNGANTVGNLTGVAEAGGGAVTYGYDKGYRLTRDVRTGTNAYSHSFTYDLNGNATAIDSNSYTYDSANKLTALSYDADGNPTSGQTLNAGLTWDDNNNLATMKGSSSGMVNTYGPTGLRVSSSPWSYGQTGSARYFVYNGDQLLGEVNSSGSPITINTWGATGLVSERRYDEKPSGSSTTVPLSLFYTYGPQGETRKLTNSTGAVVDTYKYTAYGAPVASTGSDTNPFKYGGEVGYYTDPNANGMVLCTHRWYYPAMGRWISRDPIEYNGGLNLYGYCGDDPVGGIDPEGFDPQPKGGTLTDDSLTQSTAQNPQETASLLKETDYTIPKNDPRFQKLLDFAKGKYPKKACKPNEAHHIEPKYLGGPDNGPTTPVNPAYHQMITNAFRALRRYGKAAEKGVEEGLEDVQKVMQKVYSKFPLPK